MSGKEKFERYNRNIIIDEIGIEGQQKLLDSRVLVAGAGGLGSTVISCLSSTGIGTIGIIDNDRVELSNLNRQYIHKFDNIGKNKVDSAEEWINSFNPDIKINKYQIRLDESNCSEIISQYDVVIDCFDSYESKFLLNKACIKNNKTLIHGGVAEFYGQVMTILPGHSACLSCLFPDRNEYAYVLKGVISPVVSVISSIQALEAVKVLLNFNKLLYNCILSYDGVEQTFKKISVDKKTCCPVCGKTALHNC